MHFTDTRKAYDLSEDVNLKKYIEDALSGKLPKKSFYKINEVIPQRLAEDIERLIGFSVKDFGNEISPNHIKHINDRHGESGKADHSMKDISDFARIGYVIENYDRVIKGDINKEYGSRENRNDTFPVVDNAISPTPDVQNEPQSNVSFDNIVS